MRLLFAPVLFALLMLCGAVQAQPAQLTPAQTAWLNAEMRKADEAFVKAVANIADVRRSVVERARPAPSRITDPAERVITSLEMTTGKPLSDEQKSGIRAADADRQKTKSQAVLNARKH
jgi:signal transduction histidine kinase